MTGGVFCFSPAPFRIGNRARPLRLEFSGALYHVTTGKREDLRYDPLSSFTVTPCSLVYREASSGPQIYAVAHQHRNAKYWQERL